MNGCMKQHVANVSEKKLSKPLENVKVLSEFPGIFWAICSFFVARIHAFINQICDALCDLVIFLQFKKRGKDPWRSVNFSKTAGLACNFAKINTPPWVFSTFFKLYKCYQNAQRTTYEVCHKTPEPVSCHGFLSISPKA